ncbi:hypothetical protein AeMF1_007241, partial [Aphanomyces euteiches]
TAKAPRVLSAPFSNSPAIPHLVIMGKAFLTLEDLKMCFSLFCCVYGVGTLSMPKNYASAGFAWATVALVFMALVNIYATVCISKIMLVAPQGRALVC